MKTLSLLESFFCTPGLPCNPHLWVMISVTGNLSPRDSVVWASGLVVTRTFWASGDEGMVVRAGHCRHSPGEGRWEHVAPMAARRLRQCPQPSHHSPSSRKAVRG